jgi:hypothetical protein
MFDSSRSWDTSSWRDGYIDEVGWGFDLRGMMRVYRSDDSEGHGNRTVHSVKAQIME